MLDPFIPCTNEAAPKTYGGRFELTYLERTA